MKRLIYKSLILTAILLLSNNYIMAQDMINTDKMKTETIVLGGGCFWCIEAAFQEVDGVTEVVSGYAGGTTKEPTYKEVTTGATGHAEVCAITFNPAIIALPKLLDVFFTIHNPTTPNRQGADVGTQYRSVILYTNDQQKQIAQTIINNWTNKNYWDDPIVTELKPLEIFYKAENYHQDYFKNNPHAPYCSFVVKPKVKKLKQTFPELINIK